ncbi:hypothetical protein Tco_1083528 [Tanacetum coccineum]
MGGRGCSVGGGGELYDEELEVSRLQDASRKRWNRVYHVFDESFEISGSVVKYSKEPHNPTKWLRKPEAKYAARGGTKVIMVDFRPSISGLAFRIYRIPLLGLSSAIHILRMGNSDLISGDGSTTTLAKMPVITKKV